MKRTADSLSLFDLMQMYPTEKDAIRYTERIRWRKTPCCIRYGSTDKINLSKKRFGDHWRSFGKQAVLGMRGHGDKVKAMPVANTTRQTLQGIVHENVRSGSTICTDEGSSYTCAANRHLTMHHSAREFVNGMAHVNGIESVWAVLKMTGETITYKELTTREPSQ